MTLFDLIAIAVIGVSALIGFSRGAVRELVGLFAFVVSAAGALFLLPWTGALARQLASGALASTALAVLGGFALVYLVFKMLGHVLASRIHQQPLLGGADRSLGLGVGAARALFMLGLFALVFDHATPESMRPRWVTEAFLYPLADASGRMLGHFAPSGLQAAGQFGPLLKSVVGDPGEAAPPSEAAAGQTPTLENPLATNHLVISAASAQKDAVTPRAAPERAKGRGYTKQTRESLDAIVEKTR